MDSMHFEQYYNYELSNGVTVRALQMKLLEIFLYLQKICEENHLTYWCGGGTMLGAVRHHGFIPWDNDLDVFVPRPDYEKLHRIWPVVADTERYRLVKSDRNHNYHHTASNLVDMYSTYVCKHVINEDIYHGVYIDVIPFEGVPESRIQRAIQIYHSIMYSVYNVQRLPVNQGWLLKLPTWILLKLVRGNEKRYEVWKKHEKKMTEYNYYEAKYVKELVTSFRALFWPYERSVFDPVDAEFEGHKVKIPAGYDLYMRQIYGDDYMDIPKNPDMSTRYGVVEFLDLDTPYTEYRGIRYLKGQK